MATQNNEQQKKSNVKKAAEAAKAAKSAQTTVKATAKIAAGDVAGGVKDILKDENLRNIILGAAAFLIAIPIMMFSMVPSVLMLPSEDAYSNNDSSSLFDIIMGWFGFHSAEAAEIDDMVGFGMIDEQSLKIVADQDTTDVDFETAPENADSTMDKMMEVTIDRYNKRYKKIKEYIKNDYDAQKENYDVPLFYNVNDPLASGATTEEKEAAKLMSLYTVQTDGVITDDDFGTYLDWLGDQDRGILGFFKEVEEDYDDWEVKPYKWVGTMLPQKQQDEATRAKGNGTYNEDDYEDYFTSAVYELLKVEENINETESYDEDGNLSSVTLTYTIKVRTVDEVCDEVVKFDEAKETDESGNTKILTASAWRSDYYQEMVGSGTGKGITLSYFGITSGSGTGGYTSAVGSGGGSDIVAVAISQIGVVEVPENNVLYNTWFYGGEVSGSSYPWCCAFVSWCANECGLIDSGVITKTAGCSEMLSYLQGQGCLSWSTSDTSQTPQPGDFVIRGSGAHIGIVEKYEDGTLYTIEGNSGPGISDVDNNGGCVARHEYTDIDGSWHGTFVRPNYPASAGSTGAVGETTDCTGYDLTDAQINYIAGIALREAGDDDTGISYVLSHMANICEYWWSNGIYASKSGDLYATVNGNAWWAGGSTPTVTQKAKDLVKSVIVEGHRTLPPYVIEYDGFSEIYTLYSGQTNYLTIDGKNAPGNKILALQIVQSATPGVSKVIGSFGGSGTFYTYLSDGTNGNIFYYSESYKAALGY